MDADVYAQKTVQWDVKLDAKVVKEVVKVRVEAIARAGVPNRVVEVVKMDVE